MKKKEPIEKKTNLWGDDEDQYYMGRICPMCGKEFFPPDSDIWVYKIQGHNKKLVCSYHCVLEFDTLTRSEKRKIFNKN